MNINDLKRWRSEQGPGWPEAWINLIDALRDYVTVDRAVARDLLREECITYAQYAEGAAKLEPIITLLERLEAHGIDPSLGGVIKKEQP
jgi:hypothetical protein